MAVTVKDGSKQLGGLNAVQSATGKGSYQAQDFIGVTNPCLDGKNGQYHERWQTDDDSVIVPDAGTVESNTVSATDASVVSDIPEELCLIT